MDDAEADVLAYMTRPSTAPSRHSTNPIGGDRAADRSGRHLSKRERLVRLVGAILLEHNDEWAVQRASYMSLETIGL